jgi:hypothetical protein
MTSMMTMTTVSSMSEPRLVYFPEPLLEFGFGQRMEYARDGLYLYGALTPRSEVPAVRYGAIGTPEGIRRLQRWCTSVAGYIDIPVPGPRSRAVEPQHVPFPGFSEAFGADWSRLPAYAVSTIDQAEIERCLRLDNRHEAVHQTVSLYVERLVHENNRLENPPAFWFVVIPELIYQLGRPQSVVPKAERVPGDVHVSPQRARALKREPTLFGVEEQEAMVYEYATHFRRQLKARLLDEKIVTQIVRETTLTPDEFIRPDGRPMRRLEDPATLAWNMSTGAYYKGGGRPWQLAEIRPGVCYVGLVYKRSDLTSERRFAVCAAQMFLTNGDGIVFRGALGPWYREDLRQFHLDTPAAKSLVATVVEHYISLHGSAPRELFIHSKSAFSNEEWDGFSAGVPTETALTGVQISPANRVKLFRPGNYPTIRGTALRIDERRAYLWTTGYVPRLDTYMGPETPNPIWVRVLRGACPIDTVLSDILGLTKMNFNACKFNDRMPVTIKFADEVGEVLMAAPKTNGEPRLPFKFYI